MIISRIIAFYNYLVRNFLSFLLLFVGLIAMQEHKQKTELVPEQARNGINRDTFL